MNPYVLSIKNPKDLIQEFKKIGVDQGGIDIMRCKGVSRLVKLHGVQSFVANILKQEMLSLGGDVALSRWSVTGRDKKTDCLLMGNLSQFRNLATKLQKQPFNLKVIGSEINFVLNNIEISSSRTRLMGIINATPDSFSGDGLLGNTAVNALAIAQGMVRNGVDILDIGGESSRPNAKRISFKEEVKRVLPVLKQLKGKIKVPLSIDTVKSEVAHVALDLGVGIINDISALSFDKKMAKLIARYKASVVLTHMKGSPKTMQKNPRYDDIIGEIVYFLRDAIKRALDSGIARDKIIIDPGIGFGKTLENNLEILNKLSSFKSFGLPVLVGLSRKQFIGSILNAEVSQRLFGTVAAASLAIANGADILRIHDVKEMKQAVLVADALTKKEGVC